MEALTPQPSLVFIGFMAAGKTKAARAAGEHLGLEPLDADAALEEALGVPIAEFFEREGEEEFRRREAEVVVEMLGRAGGAPVALGGGSVLSDAVAAALGDHVVVWLDVVRGGRLGSHRRHAAGRSPATGGSSSACTPSAALATRSSPTPRSQGVARRSTRRCRRSPPCSRRRRARSSSGRPASPATTRCSSATAWSGASICRLPGARFCVTDSSVGGIYAERLAAEAIVDVEPGESAKTLTEAERVLGELAAAGMRRSDHILALGGGVVGDLAGFCASVYQRGVPVVQLPTTVVAQVDSAYGGKTGVDIAAAKNYVGAYHQPAAVVADLDTLQTLPAEELAAGFVEVLKTGLLAGGALWESVRALEALSASSVAPLVLPCARYKLAVVAVDERDGGLRMALNLGHTVGHAIEAASGYARYRHGEAVGLGLLAALRMSGADELRTEVREILGRHGLPTALEAELANR